MVVGEGHIIMNDILMCKLGRDKFKAQYAAPDFPFFLLRNEE